MVEFLTEPLMITVLLSIAGVAIVYELFLLNSGYLVLLVCSHYFFSFMDISKQVLLDLEQSHYLLLELC